METDEPAQPNLATETKYSLVKNSIVKAEQPEELEEVADVEIHASDHEDDGDDEQSDDDNERLNKSVKFNEANNFVAEVGNTEAGDKLEQEEVGGPVSARAVSTPASESSPRQSQASQILRTEDTNTEATPQPLQPDTLGKLSYHLRLSLNSHLKTKISKKSLLSLLTTVIR